MGGFERNGHVLTPSGVKQKPIVDVSATALVPSPKHARAQGFTGDACINCGSMMMVRTGICNTCQACGTTTGCS